jgi:hypothetical protein
MKFAVSSAAVAALAANVAAQSVSGAAEGFAAGVTGGGVSYSLLLWTIKIITNLRCPVR